MLFDDWTARCVRSCHTYPFMPDPKVHLISSRNATPSACAQEGERRGGGACRNSLSVPFHTSRIFYLTIEGLIPLTGGLAHVSDSNSRFEGTMRRQAGMEGTCARRFTCTLAVPGPALLTMSACTRCISWPPVGAC